MAESYEKAGVNLEAGYEVVRRIKKHVASTSRLGVIDNCNHIFLLYKTPLEDRIFPFLRGVAAIRRL